MMARRSNIPSLLDRLPLVRGRIEADADLAPRAWFRTGGLADILFEPADEKDLADFLAATPSDIPVTVIGAGSNLLIRDGGVRGVVVQLGAGFSTIQITDDGIIHAGAGVMDVKLASAARDAGLTGLEFMRGIPGTMGGAARMNAGAFGGEVKDIFAGARGIDRQGRYCDFTPAEAGFAYRHSAFPADVILTRISVHGPPGDRAAISARMAEIAAERSASQPVGARTGGSTFANPLEQKAAGRKAWELIDAAGCRGLRAGGAMVSEKHCNFLINCGTATSADLEQLGEFVRSRVMQHAGIELHWEIQRLGESGGQP
ncbi:MAG: UDP-N-acetylmuramate dehydrogenase [Alphaproteobacteria bacterium]|nr:UDP-N-acetylmuramate dehydrogenase [Alphaproteobacteria bacterium]